MMQCCRMANYWSQDIMGGQFSKWWIAFGYFFSFKIKKIWRHRDGCKNLKGQKAIVRVTNTWQNSNQGIDMFFWSAPSCFLLETILQLHIIKQNKGKRKLSVIHAFYEVTLSLEVLSSGWKKEKTLDFFAWKTLMLVC